jgi:flavin reductase (DIM6/NTAB) family NADH-FMN oxidoreductase RutF
LQHNVEELTGRYRRWSKTKTKAETTVAVFYVSDYGYSDRLSQSVASGITKTGVAVEMVDMRASDLQEIQELVSRSAGIVISMPPTSANANVKTALSTVLAAVKGKQAIGLHESGGGDDEPIDPLLSKFRDLGLNAAFPAIKIKDLPTENTYKLCEEAGTDLGQWLTRDRSIKDIKAIDSNLEKALGRISSGLYIITAQKGDVTSAMLASWVSQASFMPLGFTIAIAKDRAIESLMQVGDRFVLNALEEGNHLHLMKHFLKRFSPGADRFAGIKTQIAENGSPILTDALAYLECTVTTRMETSDHWIVYSTVDAGRVSKPDALTAVHHRKVANYY